MLARCLHMHVCSYWCAACDSVHSVCYTRVGVRSMCIACACWCAVCVPVGVQPVFAGCGVPVGTVPPGVAAARRGVPAPRCGRAVVLSPRGPCRGGGCPALCPHAGGGKLSSRGHPHCRRGSGHSRGGGSVGDAHRGEPEPLQLRALRGNQTPRVSGALISGPRATCRFDEPCFLLERGDEGGPRTSSLSGWQSHRDCQDQAGLAGAAGIAEQR